MDGECALCSFGARLIARFDKAQEFRICRAQSPLGQALFSHYGLTFDGWRSIWRATSWKHRRVPMTCTSD
jgi:predicted DCC family thiol-disulfide oxidoreductase YuxK